MNIDTTHFAVLGNDRRQEYLSRLLGQKGYHVAYFEQPHLPSSWNGEVCLLPIPLHTIPDMDFAKMQRCHTLFAGCIPASFAEKAAEYGVVCHDYMSDEQVIWQNTIATAEGAIAEAIMHSPGNLTHSHVLVIGYGHCGQTLVDLLDRFGCHITVCDEKETPRTMALVRAHNTIHPHDLDTVIPDVSYIFNTAPAPVLTKKELEKVSADTLILDLASAPGGVDQISAAALSLHVRPLPGLPARVAPLVSAQIMLDFILRTLS